MLLLRINSCLKHVNVCIYFEALFHSCLLNLKHEQLGLYGKSWSKKLYNWVLFLFWKWKTPIFAIFPRTLFWRSKTSTHCENWLFRFQIITVFSRLILVLLEIPHEFHLHALTYIYGWASAYNKIALSCLLVLRSGNRLSVLWHVFLRRTSSEECLTANTATSSETKIDRH